MPPLDPLFLTDGRVHYNVQVYKYLYLTIAPQVTGNVTVRDQDGNRYILNPGQRTVRINVQDVNGIALEIVSAPDDTFVTIEASNTLR